MLILFATSKTMNFDEIEKKSVLEKDILFKEETGKLIKHLKTLDVEDIIKIMKVSDSLAMETKEKINDLGKINVTPKPSVFTFTGEVFKNLEPFGFSNENLEFCEKHLRILSGLYGVVSPMTLIEPYRLEMGYKLGFGGFNKVSDFWKESITKYLNDYMHENKMDFIINLASKEYTDSIDKKNIKSQIIDISFKEKSGDKLKTIAVYAKKARGKMAKFIIANKIVEKSTLKEFCEDGYLYNEELSKEKELVFVR